MLILQRKAGESLLIGEEIELTVLSVEAGRVRLAIEAPRNVPVLRSELRRAAEVNREAAGEEVSPLALLDVLRDAPEAERPEEDGGGASGKN